MLAREGYSTIVAVFVFSALVVLGVSYAPDWIGYIIYPLAGALCLLVLFFFRDPERSVPAGQERLVISPADGKIVQVQTIDEPAYINGKATQISIFLSPLDVHVNRVPVSGKVEYVKYYPGQYLMAWEDRASEMNEQAHFGVLHPSGMKMLFKQITGFLARRIVYYIEEGDQIKAGERFGIMKFGSRMDILLPESIQINVKKGDRTVAGESILGEIPTR
ncbi:MAG: phosphatidylserine decarboxylase family protein [Balneolaceae bacterium]